MELAKAAYAYTALLPGDERYGFVSQIRRAAISIPSNIAEGAGRGSAKEFAHFLGIARGSLNEIHTQLRLAQDIYGYVFPSNELIDEVGRMLHSLKSKLKTEN